MLLFSFSFVSFFASSFETVFMVEDSPFTAGFSAGFETIASGEGLLTPCFIPSEFAGEFTAMGISGSVWMAVFRVGASFTGMLLLRAEETALLLFCGSGCLFCFVVRETGFPDGVELVTVL